MSATSKAEFGPIAPPAAGPMLGGGDAPGISPPRRWAAHLALGLIIPAAVVGWAELRYGSIRVALAAAQGASLFVENPVQSVGTHPAGGKAVARLRVWNFTPRAATILGASASCGCVSPVALPLTLPASTSAEVSIDVQFGPNPGPLSQQLTFYTDVPDRPNFRVQVDGLGTK